MPIEKSIISTLSPHQPRRLILTCEHAVNTLPEQYGPLFKDKEIFKTHRAIDFGAYEIYQYFKKHLPYESAYATHASRLLIDCNRSLSHPHCFSIWSNTLSPEEKNQCISQYYHPFRSSVFKTISDCIQHNHPVLHLSIHSFTPVLNNKIRTTDIGLLYDPKRAEESKWATAIQHALQTELPEHRIHKNAPYRGTSDGHTTALRRSWSDQWYIGIELEINQKYTVPTIDEIFLNQFGRCWNTLSFLNLG